MSTKEYPINLGQSITLDRKLSFAADGNTYEEKPRSAVVAGYIEAGTPVAVVGIEGQDYKGTNKFVCALPTGEKLHFHFNHLKPRESKKNASNGTGTVAAMTVQQVQMPTTAVGRLQANRAQQAAVLDQMHKLGEQIKVLEAAEKELLPAAQAEVKKLQADLNLVTPTVAAPIETTPTVNEEGYTDEEVALLNEINAQG